MATVQDVAPTQDREPAASAGQFLLSRHRWHWAEALPWLIALACYFLYPGYLALGTQILIMILFALSLDLILGYAGIVTLGHAAFFGLGAYIAGYLGHIGWGEPISGLVAAAAGAAVLGIVSGWVLLRTHGLTLLMLTLATAVLLYELANTRADITGGFDGLTGIEIDPILGLFSFDLWFRTAYLYALAVLFVMFLLIRTMVHSPFGAMLIGIRENVKRMHAIGTPVHRRLVLAYAISGAIAGVAGGVFAQTQQFVTLHVLAFDLSGTILIMLILGGSGRLYGAFIGAAVYKLLEDELAKLSPEFWQFGLGLVLVLTVMFARQGLLGLVESFGARFRRGSR